MIHQSTNFDFEQKQLRRDGWEALDFLGIADLIQFGIVVPPSTLVKNMENVCEPCQSFASRPPTNLAFVVDKVATELRAAVEEIGDQFHPKTLRLSGGMDSRTVLGSFRQDQLVDLVTESVVTPGLPPELDADLTIAAAISKAYNVPHIIIVQKPEFIGYLYSESKDRLISGIYGGEFLGGQYETFFPVPIDLRPGGTMYLRESYDRFSELQFRSSPRKLKFYLMLNSVRSVIYDSIRYSWAEPNLLNKLSVSPFTNPKVLEGIFDVPNNELKNYGFYRKVYDRLNIRGAKFQMSSPATGHFPDLKRDDAKIDPKSILASSTREDRSINPDFLEFLSSNLGIDLRKPEGPILIRLQNLANFVEHNLPTGLSVFKFSDQEPQPRPSDS